MKKSKTLKTFYCKITTLSKAFQYAIHFDETPLARGKKGKGDYVVFKANDRVDLRRKFKDFDFNGLTGIVRNPIGE